MKGAYVISMQFLKIGTKRKEEAKKIVVLLLRFFFFYPSTFNLVA